MSKKRTAIDVGVTDRHLLDGVGSEPHVIKTSIYRRRSLMRDGTVSVSGASNVKRMLHPTLHGSRHRPYGHVLYLSPQMRPTSLRHAP
jgi:hypothetical protein